MPTDEEPREEQAGTAFLATSAIVHVLCWGAALAIIVWQARRWGDVFSDLGVELPAAAVAIISFADAVTGYWFVAIPLMVFLILGANATAFALCRSHTVRGLWTAAGIVIPLALTCGAIVALRRTMTSVLWEIS